MKTIFVSGGMGFLGSHCCVELINAGYDPIIVDNLSNSSATVLDGIEAITGKRPPFYPIDLTDKQALAAVFAAHPIDAAIHFAGYKAVGESKEKPLAYYENNLGATICLLYCMEQFGVERLVFSSSATVYDAENHIVLREDTPLHCQSPYGWSKYMSEQIIRDYMATRENGSAVLLRYFNPVGAHESSLIGEAPRGIPDNLMPFITQTAIGIREKLSVFGDDYDTPDGSGVRDYIHVTDLARGHIAALDYSASHTGTEAINLGSGHGTSVLELLNTFQTVNGVAVPHEIGPRRAGDAAIYYADCHRAKELLNWEVALDLDEMCRSAWRWEQRSRGNGANL